MNDRNTDYHLLTSSGTVHYGAPPLRSGWHVIACTGRAMRLLSRVGGPVTCKACLKRYGAEA